MPNEPMSLEMTP